MFFIIVWDFVILHGRGQYVEGFGVGFWLVGVFLSLLQYTFTDVECTKTKQWRTPNWLYKQTWHLERKNGHTKCRSHWKYWSLNGFYCKQDRESLLDIIRMENLQQLLLTFAYGHNLLETFSYPPQTRKPPHATVPDDNWAKGMFAAVVLFLQSYCSQDRQDWGTLLLGDKKLGMFRQIRVTFRYCHIQAFES